MNRQRTCAITRRIFRDLKNDKRTLALIVIAPVLAMVLFGLAFSGEVRDVKTIVVNNDIGVRHPITQRRMSFAKKIISHVDEKVLNIMYMSSLDQARKAAAGGKASAVIYFPEDFTGSIIKRSEDPSYKSTSKIKVILDRSNAAVSDAIIQNITRGIGETLSDSGYEMPSTIDVSESLFAAGAKFMDFFVPGVMSFVVYLLTTLLTLLSFVNEKTANTLKRMMSTPVTEGDNVAGYCIAFSVIGMLQAGLLLAVGIFVFHIMIAGNILLAFLVIAMLAVSCQALGILLSSLARRELEAIQLFPLIALPGFLLGGVFWPIEAIPAWIRPVSYCLPITYAVDACRSVILRGWGFEKIALDLGVLFCFAVIFILGAVYSLKRRE